MSKITRILVKLQISALACLLGGELAWADDYQACMGPSHEQSAIDSCTALIAKGGFTNDDLSAIYNNRGAKFFSTERHEQAFADFEMAVRLNPASATAIDNRGMGFEEHR